jgi:DNA-binding response OmpR family regulator
MNKILIIDDDKELCALIKHSVLQESIEADCCLNGKFELPPKEFDIFLLLAQNQGKILAKQQIYGKVWGEDYVYGWNYD